MYTARTRGSLRELDRISMTAYTCLSHHPLHPRIRQHGFDGLRRRRERAYSERSSRRHSCYRCCLSLTPSRSRRSMNRSRGQSIFVVTARRGFIKRLRWYTRALEPHVAAYAAKILIEGGTCCRDLVLGAPLVA